MTFRGKAGANGVGPTQQAAHHDRTDETVRFGDEGGLPAELDPNQ
jgi:hypothetical protein